jgi:Zn-dependent protease
MIMLVGIGWGKPVAIDANRLRPGPKIGMALVGIAGPISNLLLAVLLALPLRFHLLSFSGPMVSVAGIRTYFSTGCIFETLVSFSLGLAVFNLIPISPLDGSRIWQVLLPQRWYNAYARYEILGIILVIALVLGDAWLHLGILDRLLLPALNWLWQPIVGFGHPFSCILG